MNNNRNNRRRGRGNRNQSGNGNQLNRIDSRARGNAPQLLEKYKKLAQDAQHNGDRVQMEYYLQFADHYFRVIADNKARQDEARGGRRNDERDQNDDGAEDDGDMDRARRHDRGPRQRRDERDGRDADPREFEEGDYGQEGEPFLTMDDGDRAEEASEVEAESRPARRRQPSRKTGDEAQGERAPRRAERAEAKPETRRRKPRRQPDGEAAGIDSSVLPPSIRGDDRDGSSGDNDGTLEAVG